MAAEKTGNVWSRIVRFIYRTSLRGLAGILPLALTIYLIVWLAKSAESAIGTLVRTFLPEKWYVPGMGLAVGFGLVLVVGMLLRTWLAQKIQNALEALVKRIPLLRDLYGGLKDLLGFFDKSKLGQAQRVVVVKFGDPPVRLVGLVTRDEFSDVPKGIGDEDTVAVYLQMSYQLGGYTLMVPRSMIEQIDMPVDEAFRFVLTAGVSESQGESDEESEST